MKKGPSCGVAFFYVRRGTRASDPTLGAPVVGVDAASPSEQIEHSTGHAHHGLVSGAIAWPEMRSSSYTRGGRLRQRILDGARQRFLIEGLLQNWHMDIPPKRHISVGGAENEGNALG